jgi:hypothetical protein
VHAGLSWRAFLAGVPHLTDGFHSAAVAVSIE